MTSPASPRPDGVRHALTRRALLGLGVALGAGTLVAGSAVGYVLWPRPPAPGRVVLSSVEEDFLSALADAYLPPGNPFVVTGDALDLGPVDAYVASLPYAVGRQLRALLVALEGWPGLSFGGRFSSLDRADRSAVLGAFEDSTLADRRQVAHLLRMLIAIPLFEDERARHAADATPGCGFIP